MAGSTSKLEKAWKVFLRIKTILIVVAVPIIFLPVALVSNTKQARCAYVIIVVAIYWITEALPLAVTALVPMVALPAVGVLKAKTVAGFYMRDTIMLFMGGLMIAIAMEKWNLHKRIALRMLLFFGSKPVWLMLGCMCVTAFLSMWISNTATTAMVYPIMEAVMMELKPHIIKKYKVLHSDSNGRHKKGSMNGQANPTFEQEMSTTNSIEESRENSETDIADEKEVSVDKNDSRKQSTSSTSKSEEDRINNEQPEYRLRGEKIPEPTDPAEKYHFMLMKAMMIAVAYGANIGGSGTITGTPPNLELKGQLEIIFPNNPDLHITFGKWFIFAFPNMAVNLLLAWLWLVFFFFCSWDGIKHFFKHPKCVWRPRCQCCRKKHHDEDTAEEMTIISDEYKKLGPLSFAEGSVLFLFVLLVLLWFFRKPSWGVGWGDIFLKGYASDGMSAIFVGVILFAWPSQHPRNMFKKSIPPLMDWYTLAHKLPWDVLILLGGGFSIANASTTSGLSRAVGGELAVLGAIPLFWLIMVISALITTATEVMSNTATATIFLPIAAETARKLKFHPFYLMIPGTLACSYAFMLPISTPPNAIVFSSGYLRVIDMMKTGIVMNLISVVWDSITIHTWGEWVYGLGHWKDPSSVGGQQASPSFLTTTQPTNVTAPEICIPVSNLTDWLSINQTNQILQTWG